MSSTLINTESIDQSKCWNRFGGHSFSKSFERHGVSEVLRRHVFGWEFVDWSLWEMDWVSIWTSAHLNINLHRGTLERREARSHTVQNVSSGVWSSPTDSFIDVCLIACEDRGVNRAKPHFWTVSPTLLLVFVTEMVGCSWNTDIVCDVWHEGWPLPNRSVLEDFLPLS